jgi:hypothetical protein
MSEFYTTHPGIYEAWQDQHCGDCAFKVPTSDAGAAVCRESPPTARPETGRAHAYPSVSNETPACSRWVHWKDGPDQ